MRKLGVTHYQSQTFGETRPLPWACSRTHASYWHISWLTDSMRECEANFRGLNLLRKISSRGTLLSLTASPTWASLRYTWAESTCLCFPNISIEVLPPEESLITPISYLQRIKDRWFRWVILVNTQAKQGHQMSCTIVTVSKSIQQTKISQWPDDSCTVDWSVSLTILTCSFHLSMYVVVWERIRTVTKYRLRTWINAVTQSADKFVYSASTLMIKATSYFLVLNGSRIRKCYRVHNPETLCDVLNRMSFALKSS